MKKLFILLNSVLLLFLFCLQTAFPTPKRALAEAELRAGTYACILTDAYFYDAPDAPRGLFLLPRTYYVKILEYDETYCKIEYLYDASDVEKLIGYARTELLTPVAYTPKRPYLYYILDVRYRIDDTIDDSAFLNQITVSCAYYGDYVVGAETYCYVLRGDTFGYIPKPTDLKLPVNTEYDEYLATLLPQTSSDETEAQADSSPAQIAVLIALCLLVPVLAALLLKPPKNNPYDTDELYDG